MISLSWVVCCDLKKQIKKQKRGCMVHMNKVCLESLFLIATILPVTQIRKTIGRGLSEFQGSVINAALYL